VRLEKKKKMAAQEERQGYLPHPVGRVPALSKERLAVFPISTGRHGEKANGKSGTARRKEKPESEACGGRDRHANHFRPERKGEGLTRCLTPRGRKEEKGFHPKRGKGEKHRRGGKAVTARRMTRREKKDAVGATVFSKMEERKKEKKKFEGSSLPSAKKGLEASHTAKRPSARCINARSHKREKRRERKGRASPVPSKGEG